jgi:hypothetical protein
MISKPEKPRQVTRKLGTLVLLREGRSDPLDREWDETLKILAEHRHEIERIKVLVVTDGGGPTQAQRKRLERTLEGKTIRVAVVSDSMKVRFICSSVALFTSKLSSFKVSELRDAYVWLELTQQERHLADQNIVEMRNLVE